MSTSELILGKNPTNAANVERRLLAALNAVGTRLLIARSPVSPDLVESLSLFLSVESFLKLYLRECIWWEVRVRRIHTDPFIIPVSQVEKSKTLV